MDWLMKHKVGVIGVIIAILALVGINVNIEVEVEDSVPPAIEESVSDIIVGEIIIVEPEE